LAEFERHEKDTDQLHLELAAKAVANGRNANRTYLFAMRDRIEIAFAQIRVLTGYSEDAERVFEANYHTGIVMELDAARALHHDLGVLLSGFDVEEKKDV